MAFEDNFRESWLVPNTHQSLHTSHSDHQKVFEAHDIMATTGHKCESSIRSCATKCPLKKRRNISNVLASLLHDENVGPKVQKLKLPNKKQVLSTTVSVRLTSKPYYEQLH